MSCDAPIAEKSFQFTTSIQGLTKELSCWGEENGGGGMDLGVGVSPADGQGGGNYSSVWFRLRDYTGPGTYPLYNVDGEGNHEGLMISGNVDIEDWNLDQTVGTVACRESACEAIVAENSDTIPNDAYETHEFRVRVEVRCPAGATLTDMLCDDDATSCAFVGEPTLKFDLACRN